MGYEIVLVLAVLPSVSVGFAQLSKVGRLEPCRIGLMGISKALRHFSDRALLEMNVTKYVKCKLRVCAINFKVQYNDIHDWRLGHRPVALCGNRRSSTARLHRLTLPGQASCNTSRW